MQKARYLVALSCAYASAACGTEVAIAVYPAPVDAGPPGSPDKPPPCMSSKLTSRLTKATVMVGDGVRYKRALPFYGFPQDDRIALSTLNSNGSMVAWLNNAGTQVHVTQLTPEFNRVGNDVMIDGTDVSGLVALDDGFAVLTRRLDLGAPVGDGTVQTQATYLVRWQDGHELFAVPLTGTKSITNAPDNEKHDFPLSVPNLAPSGRLAFNGSQYGAYFGVRGGVGDRYATVNSDKLVQVDDTGQYLGGWRTACRWNLGTRLVPEMDSFVAFCMADGNAGPPGLYMYYGNKTPKRLAQEVTFSSGGYLGGNLGSAVKVQGGYAVGWASRGVYLSNTDKAANEPHEPAIALVDKDFNLIADPQWPFLQVTTSDGGKTTTRPTRDAVNVHAAPYGDKILFVWETIDSPAFSSSNGYSTGVYGGTHFRLVDAQGNTASDEEVLPDAIAPNGPDDIVQFSNLDLGWAYVPEAERNFQTPVTAAALPSLPVVSEIRFVRLTWCYP
jgi:hypothetical protein